MIIIVLVVVVVVVIIIKELKQLRRDGDGYENVTLKVNSRSFKLYRTYSISFNSSNIGIALWR